jgi:predicted metal-dependent enzyme (double-stranded beta helix superfamily)
MTVTVGYQAAVEQDPRPAGRNQVHRSQVHRSQASLGRLVGEIVADQARWSQLVRFTEPQRWYQRLELADDYEIWLLSWLPGQHTGFHDHGEAVGAFGVARGRLSERTVPAGRSQARSRPVSAGTVRSFGSKHVHDVQNTWAEPAVSVHAYSPPLTAMRKFELTADGLVQVATRTAGPDW